MCVLLRFIWIPIWILIPSSTGFAKEDSDYDPALNFRPNNVTGLNSLYKWVGSYYNATLEIELTPMVGVTANDSVCPNQRNHTTTSKWDSILFITERGPYNIGPNSVNLFLAIFPPNYNLASLPYGEQILIRSPLLWPLHSSEPTWIVNNATTEHDSFNMTTTKNSNKSFSLSGTFFGYGKDASGQIHNVSMPACNSSIDTGDWRVYIIEKPSWNTRGWDSLTLPEVHVDFNGENANLTIDGSYFANSIKKNHLSSVGRAATTMGRIQMRFNGTLDAYHSDVLDMNSSTPAWLRTVGFGNNSLNIANDSGATSLFQPSQCILLPFLVILASLAC